MPFIRVSDLVELQDLEDQAQALRDEAATLEAELADESSVGQADEQLHAAKEALHRAELSRREAEQGAEEWQAKTREEEARLYSGKGMTPRELAAMEHEIVTRKERQRELDEDALLAMDAVETARTDRQRAQVHAAAVKEERVGRVAEIERQAEEFRQRLLALEEAAARKRALTSPSALRAYDRLRANGRRKAVARVSRGTCAYCRIAIPNNVLQRARSGLELVTCPSCGCILYVG